MVLPFMDNETNVPEKKIVFEATRNSLGLPTIPLRKFSFPAALNVGTDHLTLPNTTRRRFSNVGDAVSRKLSTTIGWRSGPPQEVIIIGRALCSLYVRNRLKRAGVFTRKLGLTRLRSTVGSMVICGSIARDVFPCLNCAGSELERMHPRLYCNVARQVSLSNAKATGEAGILVAVGHQLFRSEPTWGKVVAMFCIAGGLAVDCVRHGRPENLNDVLDGMTEFLEDRMAEWVAANGGWPGLSTHCQQEDQEVSFVEYSAIFALVGAVLLVAYFIVRFFIKISI